MANANQKNGKSQLAETEHSALLEFFIDELKDLYWAENHVVKSLPKMAKAATSQELKTAFENHLKESQTHVSRLEEAFKYLGEKPEAKKCEAMEGILKEGESIIADTKKNTLVRDCGLILAAQKVEHYEISSYGGLRTLAGILGQKEVQQLLQTTLDEEESTDKKLTAIAENYVNEQAAQETA